MTGFSSPLRFPESLSFRARLLLALMLVVFAVTTVAVYFAEENRRANHRRLLDAQFENQVRSVLTAQEARSKAIKDKCWSLSQAVRLRAALEERDVEDLYQNALTELGDILAAPGRANDAAALGVRASFFRFFDLHGLLLPPDNPAAGLTEGRSVDEALAGMEKILTAADDQGVGFIALARSNDPGALREVVLTRIRDWNGRILGTLAVGFPLADLRLPENGSGSIRSGVWLNHRFYSDAMGRADRHLLGERIGLALSERKSTYFPIELEDGPHLVFYRTFDLESTSAPAYEVCLYPLAASLREERALRWKIGAFGLAVLLCGFGASLFVAKKLSRPVEKIVAGSEENLNLRVQAEENLRETNEALRKALEELQATQKQVIQQERLSAVGQMASGIAHDFNNALMPILGFAEILLENDAILDDRAEARSCLEMLRTSAKDAASVVSRLREFYRPAGTDEEFPVVDLAKIVRQAVSLTEPKWRTQTQAKGLKVEVATEITESPFVAGEESALREVLTNLIFNAVDAMPKGGRICLETGIEGGEAVIRVKDSGTGMSESVRQRCLEPFFSTKGELGTGLGLSMVHGIVERHRGRLGIESVPGEGTTFVITLPLAEDAAQPMAAPIRALTKEEAALNVLIVDDEAPVLDVLSRYLRCDGHAVATAASGREALEKFRRNSFDLVVVDRAMPEMSGEQTAQLIKEVNRQTPIIMLTGFSGREGSSAHSDAVDELLHKPVTMDVLRETIGRLLHAA